MATRKNLHRWYLALFVALGITCLTAAALAEIGEKEEGWRKNATNGHWYRLTAPLTWSQAEDQAIQWGGHLVTIRDRREELWL